ncbi:hypothetical protein V6C39_04585 [Dickeya ananatis]|uniref:hypothetical protein n=1 Tax=Dickeya ananatis TaxID=3061286 RepID=UPI00388D74BF
MLWRHWLGKKSRQVLQGAACHEQAPLGVMLEARMLFDGAVAATVETAVTQNTATQTASSDTASHTDSGQSGQSTTDTTSHSTDATSNADTTSHNTDTQDSTTVADSHVAVATGSATHKEVVFIAHLGGGLPAVGQRCERRS